MSSDRRVKQLLRQNSIDARVINRHFAMAWSFRCLAYHPLRILELRFPKGQYLPLKVNIYARFKGQNSEPYSRYSGRFTSLQL